MAVKLSNFLSTTYTGPQGPQGPQGSTGPQGPSSMSDGTATAPGLPFATNTATGFYRPAANTLGFVTASVERMRIDSSGNVTGATISAPVLSGTATGTYTLGGTPSLAATALTGTIAAARLPAGSVLQVVNYTTGAVATGTSLIPTDDTIPQNTEGDQYMSLAITPISSISKLVIEVVGQFAHSAGGGRFMMALFQDTTANALAVSTQGFVDAGKPFMLSLIHYMTSGTTSATTFKVRAGMYQTGTTTFNGASGARLLGGVSSSSITIWEIVA